MIAKKEDTKTTNAQVNEFKIKAKNVLEQNDRGTFTVPNSELYPHQWLWDSCFIAIGLASYDVHRAQVEIKSLLRGQWSNGMMPSIILRKNRRSDEPTYDRHDRIWRSWLNPSSPHDLATSGITQPPMLAEAITRIGAKLNKDECRLWYKQVYPGLVRYHKWLYQERDPHKEGLVLLIHPWETGLDNTPPWMNELHDHLLPSWIRVIRSLKLDTVFGWFRSDKRFVSQNERLNNVEALAFYSVQRRLRRKNYDFERIIDHSMFAIEDLTFNSILIRANRLLKDIAAYIDEKLDEELLESMSKAENQLAKLWDEYATEYFSRDFISHRLLKESSVAAFMPLYSGAISRERANRIIESLTNEHRFGSPYPVPSAPLDSAWFSQRNYWQGPTWVNTNWLVIDGLTRYGFNDLADSLRNKTIKMINKSGFYEYFNPINSEGLGADKFSWTAALYLDLINNKD